MAVELPEEGPGSITRGRKFKGPELYLMVLGLLKQEPRHGYEIIKELKSLSLGFYSPSPGALYPVLGQMVERGHATVQAQGKRKCYMLSAAGGLYLQKQAAAVEHLFARLRHAAKRMLWISQSMNPESATQATGWLPEFVEARRELRLSLLARSDADFHEQRRLVDILHKAIAEIESRPASSCSITSETPTVIEK